MTQEEKFNIFADVVPDVSAIELLGIFAGIAGVWDDVMDGDPVGANKVSEAFVLALINLPRNQFYQKNRTELQPVIEQAIVDWQSSIHFEAVEGGTAKATAYILREAMVAIAVRIATIHGGTSLGIRASNLFRSTLIDEPFDQYCGEVS